MIVGHATFCIVMVFNNVLARLRRTGGVARGGLDRPRRRHVPDVPAVTFPMLRSALLAGALLAFALSFDEIVVTTFTAGAERADPADLDLQNLFRPNQAPVVNVVAAVLIVVSIIPIWLAQRLSGDTAGGRL